MWPECDCCYRNKRRSGGDARECCERPASASQRPGDSGGCEGQFSHWFILYCLLESVSHPSTAAASSCD